jgi:hypothetical protein
MKSVPWHWIAAAGIAAVLIGHDAARLWAPFGPSHDGFNAALFMTGGRAIIEEGPLASQLGASSRTLAGDRVVYAHHPPFIYLASAGAYLAPGPVELRARLPALLAAFAALGLTVLVLCRCELGSGAVAMGALIAFASPMFYVFGAVTEPHIMGLPFMAGLTLMWQRLRLGQQVPVWVLAAVALGGALTSWQAALFGGVVGAALFVEQRRAAGAAVWLGTAVGVSLTGLWILWAYQGHPGDFLSRALLRAGAGAEDRVTILQMARQQASYLREGFPVGFWLTLPVLIWGVVDHRTRALVVITLGTVMAYAIAFKNGAYDHSYWLYSLLLPLALGGAAATAAVARWLATREFSRLVPLRWGVAVALVGALGFTMWRPSNDSEPDRIGATLGAEARTVAWPPQQRYAYHSFGGEGPTDLLPWLRFYAQREPMGVDGPDSIPRGAVLLQMVDGHLRVTPGTGAAASGS